MKQTLPKNLRHFIKKYQSQFNLFTLCAGKLRYPNVAIEKDYSLNHVVEIPLEKVNHIEPTLD